MFLFVQSMNVITHAKMSQMLPHKYTRAHACMMLCCNGYESSVHFFQKQQTLQRLCAERLNSCFSDVGLTVLSPFVSLFFLFLLSLSLSLCLGSRISTSNKHREGYSVSFGDRRTGHGQWEHMEMRELRV